ncbi:DUF3616 domain-containing protein [Mycolicibacterium septicum DSM 44393]|uniref:DUF3616 domain-containing protein n=1 Tax=Mycolicibacterium septicum DSM 44393 TaxID=1341646 RepID=A0A7X6MWH7_9MYCO|nr:DUF3616 domain-containing protein [Mycolicibacterium septicum]NKZ15271.1 DUF3616 domain-containing protein [Mycolicibacterium septicum DSM 44393]
MAEPLKIPRELFGDTSRIKSRSFGKRNDGVVFNASGVVQVAPERFVFIDNHDPTAVFELTLDPDNDDLKQIRRRDLVGVTEQQLGDPEGLTRVDTDGRTYLVATSSLSVSGSRVNDGLVRISYADSGDLRAEPMAGFRSWLLAHEPALAAAAASEPDDGGVNIEGVAWDPGARALLFGVRGPAEPGQVTIVEVPMHAGTAAWTTAALGAPVTRTLRVPHSAALQGIRDISYDERSGQFLILLGKSLSRKAEPFALCTWTRGADALRVTGARFGESMKPEGCTAFYRDGKRRILIVDDRGGYAVTGG